MSLFHHVCKLFKYFFPPLYLRSNTSRNTSITIKNTNSLNALQQHPEAWMRLGSLCKVLYKHIWKVISYRRIYKQHLWKHKAEVWERTIKNITKCLHQLGRIVGGTGHLWQLPVLRQNPKSCLLRLKNKCIRWTRSSLALPPTKPYHLFLSFIAIHAE